MYDETMSSGEYTNRTLAKSVYSGFNTSKNARKPPNIKLNMEV